NLIAQQFAEVGFAFVKFNFSHNGTTPDNPEEFVDLEAYAENNYTIQLDDLGRVIDWCFSAENQYEEDIDANNIYFLVIVWAADWRFLKLLKTIE
ncbi:MAG: hypothetical protein H7329_17655, partial [Opitutaceae bacterium]|nr:hypothetical protein [Cytophagales bacterium]